MSEVLQFPDLDGREWGGLRTRNVHAFRTLRRAHAGGVMSWVRAAECACCGRPTLASPTEAGGWTICGHCSPPTVA